MHTGANDLRYSAVSAQMAREDIRKSQGEQRHEQLAFISGEFRGTMFKWPIFENEAFATVIVTA